jgi:hypothetical protein
VFAVRRIVAVKVHGTHVNWVIVGALELSHRPPAAEVQAN